MYGLEPHGRMRILDLRVEQRHRVGDAVAPIAQHARGRGARPRIVRSQHPFQEGRIDAVVPLLHPEGFHHLALVLRAGLVEPRDPGVQRRQHVVAVATAQLDLGAVADAVFRLLQKIEQAVDRLAGDGRRLQQRPAHRRDAIDAAVLVIALGRAGCAACAR